MDPSSRPEVVRQHESTEIPELYGSICHAFWAICPADQATAGPLYIRLDDCWHRFFLDAGVLFWRGGGEPDMADDDELLDGESFVDWGEELGVRGVPISRIEMNESILILSFANGAEVVLESCLRDDETKVVQLHRPRSMNHD